MIAEFQNQSISLWCVVSGKAKPLKGRYIDCEQNIEQVVAAGQRNRWE
jgi:hypothetical protein